MAKEKKKRNWGRGGRMEKKRENVVSWLKKKKGERGRRGNVEGGGERKRSGARS